MGIIEVIVTDVLLCQYNKDVEGYSKKLSVFSIMNVLGHYMAHYYPLLSSTDTTIALAIIHYLIGLIPNETVQELLLTIIEALTKEDFDYWGEVKDEVMALVGQYINDHNMNQIDHYSKDLTTLLDR